MSNNPVINIIGVSARPEERRDEREAARGGGHGRCKHQRSEAVVALLVGVEALSSLFSDRGEAIPVAASTVANLMDLPRLSTLVDEIAKTSQVRNF